MATNLQQYFPSIKKRSEILHEIQSDPILANKFSSFSQERQAEFLDICTGAKGIPILYDNYFQTVMNPDTHPERVQDLIGCILGKKVVYLKTMNRSSFPLGDDKSLVILDLVIKLEDGTIINLEVQKIGHAFPGQRAATYSADLMVRQYSAAKREASIQKKSAPRHHFSYRDLHPVYTIVLIEKSGSEFQKYPDKYLHVFSQRSNTGLQMNLLMHYIFIPLDIFKNTRQNKNKPSGLDDWLIFLSTDSPKDIIELCERSPKFKPLYEDLYEICQNTEVMMGMFSRILKELDDDNVAYMIDELQEQVKDLSEKYDSVSQKYDSVSKMLDTVSEERDAALAYIEELKAKLASHNAI